MKSMLFNIRYGDGTTIYVICRGKFLLKPITIQSFFFFWRKPNFIKRNAQRDREKKAFSKKHLTHKVPIHAIVES